MQLPFLLKTILQGYLKSGRNFITVLLFLAVAGLVSLGIVYPLWLFATSHPRVYTLFCAFLLVAALVTWMFLRILSRQHDGNRGQNARDRGKKIARGLIILFLIYLTIRLFGMGLLMPGFISLILSLFLAGWLLYGPQKV